MMSKLLTSTLGAMAVMGQVPDLREGDCVKALSDIDYENMPAVKKDFRGMVTGKGITWEGRDWNFAANQENQFLFRQRNAIIHRSMVQKMSETEGYGVIRNPASGECLTVFGLEPLQGKPQSPKLQWFPCQDSWVEQMFILPACGFGPGQLRWAKDPQRCAHRNIQDQKLEIVACDWTQDFIFTIVDPAGGDLSTAAGAGQTPNRGYDSGTPLVRSGHLKVGVNEKDEKSQPECFGIAGSETLPSITGDSASGVACTTVEFAGLWNVESLDV